VLFLFVVMMLDVNFRDMRRGMMKHASMGALVGLVLVAELIWVFGAWGLAPGSDQRIAYPIPPAEEISNTHALGQLLYTHYFYLFQLAGAILLVAMIGAIVLTLRTRPGVRKQDALAQATRERKDVIEVVDVPFRTGV